MYEDIIKKPKDKIPAIIICLYCKSYRIIRASHFTQADGTNIKEEITCEDCGNKWHIIWTHDSKDFVRTES